MADRTESEPRKPIDLALPLRVIVGLGFGTIVVLTIAQVFFRFVLDSPLVWSEELSRLLLVWVTFLGAAIVCWDGTHLNVDTFYMKLPLGIRRVVRVFNGAIALIFLIILVDNSIIQVQIEHITTLGSLDIPGSYVRVPATIGGALMILFIVLRWGYRLRLERRIRGDDATVNREPM